MSLQFRVEHRTDHVRFDVAGDRADPDYAKDLGILWAQVAEACRTSGLRSVLGVNSLTGPVDTLKAFEIARALPAMFQGTGVNAAVVIRGTEEAVRDNRFAEDVAANRGLRIRLFDDEAAALAWLRSSS